MEALVSHMEYMDEYIKFFESSVHFINSFSHVLNFGKSKNCLSTCDWYESTSTRDKTGPSICVLNDDCLRHILKFCNGSDLLKKCRFVCKQWFGVCAEVLLCVKTLQLSNEVDYVPNITSVCSEMIVCGEGRSCTCDVNHRACRKHCISFMKELSIIDELCPRLTHLHLKCCPISNQYIVRRTKNLCLWKNLIELTVINCNIRELDLALIISFTKQLVKLDISYNRNITGFALINGLKNNKMTSFNFNHCDNLNSFVVGAILNIHNDTLENLHLMKVTSDLSNTKPLQSLKTFGAEFDFLPTNGAVRLRNHIKDVVYIMPALEELWLNLKEFNTTQVTDPFSLSINKVSNSLTNLARIHLNVSFFCSAWKYLDFSFLSQFASLSEVAISGNADYKSLIQTFLEKCKSLRVLSISSTRYFDFDHVICVIYDLPLVVELNIRACCNVGRSTPCNPRGRWLKLSSHRTKVLQINIRGYKVVPKNFSRFPTVVRVKISN